MLRQVGRDRGHDRRPLADPQPTPLGNCFVNCGWGTGGFKAIPGSGWAMAELVARGEPGPLRAAFGLERFREGRFIDESVAAGVAH
jgi:sarcosine oxidase subunit beta